MSSARTVSFATPLVPSVAQSIVQPPKAQKAELRTGSTGSIDCLETSAHITATCSLKIDFLKNPKKNAGPALNAGFLDNGQLIRAFKHAVYIEDLTQKTLPLALIEQEHEAIDRVIMAKNGQYLLVIPCEGFIKLWMFTENSSKSIILKNITRQIDFAVFSPDGNYLVIIAQKTVYCWDLKKTYKPIVLEKDIKFAEAVVFSPNNQHLAVIINHKVYIWQLSLQLSKIYRIRAPGTHSIIAVNFSPDSQKMLLRLSTGHSYLCHVSLHQKEIIKITTFENLRFGIFNFSSEQDKFIAITRDKVYLCDLQQSNWLPQLLTSHQIVPFNAYVSPCSQYLIMVNNRSHQLTIYQFDQNLWHQPPLQLPFQNPCSISCSSDGQKIVVYFHFSCDKSQHLVVDLS